MYNLPGIIVNFLMRTALENLNQETASADI